MSAHYRFQRFDSTDDMLHQYASSGHCFNVSDYMLYQLVLSGRDKEAREVLGHINRQRGFTSGQITELLRAAVYSNQDSTIKLILEQGLALVQQCPELSVCLLWIAVLFDQEILADHLVRSGVDVNAQLGERPLMVLNEQSTILHELLSKESSPSNDRLVDLVTVHGADLRARDSRGRTVLHYAVTRDRVRAAKLFLEKGAEVNVSDNDGMTPLLAAARGGKAEEMVPLLVKFGADLVVRDLDGMNALHWLAFAPTEYVNLAGALIGQGVSLNDREAKCLYQPIHLAAMKGKYEMVKLYLDHGADANARAQDGSFPLYLAAAKSTDLEILLERGASIDLRTARGRTALHSACEHFQAQNIRLLVSFGADILAEDQEGNTPFSLIRYRNVNPCSRLMLKELALLKSCQPWLELKDEKIIKEYPKLSDYYQNCVENIYKMVFVRFSRSCTIFDLLVRNPDEIAVLMANPKFEINFRQYDLSEFSMYADDILGAFERAAGCYRFMVEQQNGKNLCQN